MATKIRKQVYLEAEQNEHLKLLAKRQGTTEAILIRQAIDLLLAEIQRKQQADMAWQQAQALMEERAAYAVEAMTADDRGWTRTELYEEQETLDADSAS